MPLSLAFKRKLGSLLLTILTRLCHSFSLWHPGLLLIEQISNYKHKSVVLIFLSIITSFNVSPRISSCFHYTGLYIAASCEIWNSHNCDEKAQSDRGWESSTIVCLGLQFLLVLVQVVLPYKCLGLALIHQTFVSVMLTAVKFVSFAIVSYSHAAHCTVLQQIIVIFVTFITCDVSAIRVAFMRKLGRLNCFFYFGS
jgi:hypothetical protein